MASDNQPGKPVTSMHPRVRVFLKTGIHQTGVKRDVDQEACSRQS